MTELVAPYAVRADCATPACQPYYPCRKHQAPPDDPALEACTCRMNDCGYCMKIPGPLGRPFPEPRILYGNTLDPWA